ncbi:hypothetical protein WH95_05475 [Kiloniella litopenaei]|uniref:Alpha/beta hydrolase n=1 Tax=Kiloniella litopenaei TaxID=1549748 RepID=A0A0M2RBS5_9PROT|nr:alpha/beta hydrolase-fold protein [Kiloniella litopenaei]KKJ77874.1 hypothetical protein WH95_05475 [Kiloniella litopenaei]
MKSHFIIIPAILFSLFFSHAAFSQEIGHFEITRSEVHQIKSKTLGRIYEVFIRLPRGYDKKDQQQYPVIYSNDGPYPFLVGSSVTQLLASDKAILVGVSFAQDENGMASRVRDLTPIKNKSWTKYQTGGAVKFLEFIETEVISFIEKNYRTNSTRIFTGQSLGGSFGTWVLLTKPELFSHYILTSPSLWYKDNMIFDIEKKYAQKNDTLAAKVYFAIGGLETKENGMHYDMVEDLKSFTKQLAARNYKQFEMKSEIIEGTTHKATYPVGFTKGLLWLLDDL